MPPQKRPANQLQMETLINFMKENTDIARGESKKTRSRSRWESLTNTLNKMGPPTKDWQQWNRVWINFKAKMKAKFIENPAHVKEPIREFMAEILDRTESSIQSAPDELRVFHDLLDEVKIENETEASEVSNDPFEEYAESNDSIEMEFQELKSMAAKRKMEIENKRKKPKVVNEKQDIDINATLLEILEKNASLEKSLRELVDLKRQEVDILRRESKKRNIYRTKKLLLLRRSKKDGEKSGVTLDHISLL